MPQRGIGRRAGAQRIARLRDLGEQRCMVGAAVEQRGVVAAGVGADAQQVRRTARGLHIGRDGFEQRATTRPLRQQVDTIAQHRRARGLQRPPGAHARGGVLGRQRQDQGEPRIHVAYSTSLS
jgi:hypothetical protein